MTKVVYPESKVNYDEIKQAYCETHQDLIAKSGYPLTPTNIKEIHKFPEDGIAYIDAVDNSGDIVRYYQDNSGFHIVNNQFDPSYTII